MSLQVSVVVPAYNGEQFVGECIQSVLDQEFKDFELIVIDDGSEDMTSDIVEKFVASDSRVRLLHHEGHVNQGVSKSRKLGVRSASAEWIAFLDADDRYLPKKLSRQVALMEENKNIVLSHTGVLYGEKLKTASANNSWSESAENLNEYRFNDRNDFLARNPVCLSTTMVRRDTLLDLDLAYPQMFQLEDWVMCVLLSMRGNFLAISDPLTFYRKHPAQFMASFSTDPLVKNYGGLEMCLALLSRIQCGKTRESIKNRIGVLLNELAQAYASRDLASDTQSIFEQSSETDYWKQRARKAEESWGTLALQISKKLFEKFRNASKH